VTPREDVPYDKIGYWSEIKLDIIKDYAAAYSRILSAQRNPSLAHIYIDAFAGPGVHLSKTSGGFIPGSPTNALLVDPPFRAYHLIDLDADKVSSLESIVAGHDNVYVYRGDCNRVMLEQVLPQVRWEDYRRALCILDPYGLHLDWHVIAEAGRMRSVEIFLNFPVTDMNRNVLWRDREGVSAEQEKRMTRFWGDDSWRRVVYQPSRQGELFGPPLEEKVTNEEVVAAFRERLQKVAGFKNVPEAMAMRNSQNAVVYYLFFASQKPVAEGIVRDIFAKYRDRGGV
jgi:three-Cys-motif partner protein